MHAPLSDEELTGWLRLLLTPGVGPDTARRLLAAFGLPDQVFAQPLSALRQVVGPAQAEALRCEPEALADQHAQTRAWLDGAEHGQARRVLTLADADYPAALLALSDPPPLLYLLGQTTDWAQALPTRGLAVVGSRNPTPQGLANARQFARALREAGLCIVSGLALGVDGAAHQGALDAADVTPGPATVAVVGTGLDRVYPRQHRALAPQVAARGLLLSEYPLGTPPLTANFPRRNRLIAALAQGTLVVEAAAQSGSLITARLAAELGREVLAIPGSIHSPQARGCHALIRQGARLVESAQDVLDELRLPAAPLSIASQDHPARTAAENGTNPGDPDSPGEAGLLRSLGHDPVSLDALQARTGLDTARLQALLLTLELQGQVARLPGGLFQRQALA